MNRYVIESPLEASVKTWQQFQDLELIRLSQAGDTEAFGELVTKHRSKIFTIVLIEGLNSQTGKEQLGTFWI